MTSRFHKRGSPPEVTFFVFQDILTSMIGIMIIVTLALALQADDTAGGNKTDEALEQFLKVDLDKALEEVANLRLRSASIGATPGLSPSLSSIEAEEENLRRQIAVFGQSIQAKERDAAAMKPSGAESFVAGELKGLRSLIENARTKRANLERQAQRKEAALNETRRSVQNAEAALVSEKSNRDVLRLIPELSGTTKEPVLVVVGRDGFEATKFDSQQPTAQAPPYDFGKSLKNFNSSEQFLVVFFRPSAAHLFKDYVQTAKSAGFEIGYDLISEDLKFQLSKP